MLIIIYDGDCGFCQTTVDLINKLDWLHSFKFVPYQKDDTLEKYNFLTAEMCEKQIYLVKPNGRYYGGYDAFKIMSLYLPLTFLISWFFFLPGIVHLGRFIYKVIAANRHKIRLGNKMCKVTKK